MVGFHCIIIYDIGTALTNLIVHCFSLDVCKHKG